jgi:hypothetical protein
VFLGSAIMVGNSAPSAIKSLMLSFGPSDSTLRKCLSGGICATKQLPSSVVKLISTRPPCFFCLLSPFGREVGILRVRLLSRRPNWKGVVSNVVVVVLGPPDGTRQRLENNTTRIVTDIDASPKLNFCPLLFASELALAFFEHFR